jgi:signal transduction histidine kinase
MSTATPTPAPDDEARDLQLVLLAGGMSALALGLVGLLALRTPVLNIPAYPTLVLASLIALTSIVARAALMVGWPARLLAWVVLSLNTVFVTAAVHFTGGPQTPMPGLYLLVIAAAAFVLGTSGAIYITAGSLLAYAALLILEYAGVLPVIEIWNVEFNAGERGLLLGVNWLAVAIPAVISAYMSGSLAHRLRARTAELRQSEQARKVLVELMVHDLRNPLTVLVSTLELIQITASKALAPDMVDMVINARRSGTVMAGLISDMLDIARLEAGQLVLKPQRIDVPALLREAVSQAKVPAEQLRLNVTVTANGALPEIVADQQLIQRVLANLVGNAITHTPPGGSITLEAQPEPTGYITLSVRDSGQGIPLEQQQRIFERFAQVERGGTRRRGTGLGLTFCRMAVEAHRGRIWVESKPGAGSVFAFTLPVQSAAIKTEPTR